MRPSTSTLRVLVPRVPPLASINRTSLATSSRLIHSSRPARREEDLPPLPRPAKRPIFPARPPVDTESSADPWADGTIRQLPPGLDLPPGMTSLPPGWKAPGQRGPDGEFAPPTGIWAAYKSLDGNAKILVGVALFVTSMAWWTISTAFTDFTYPTTPPPRPTYLPPLPEPGEQFVTTAPAASGSPASDLSTSSAPALPRAAPAQAESAPIAPVVTIAKPAANERWV